MNVQINNDNTLGRKKITVGGKTHEMPPIAPLLYMEYMELREEIFDTEGRRGMFTRAQFISMTEMLVKLYGNSFTPDELMDPASGLGVGDIIAEFAAIEIAVGGDVNEAIGRMRTNFTGGK